MRDRGHVYPEYHIAVLRAEAWRASGANLIWLIECFDSNEPHAPPFHQHDGDLLPLSWALAPLTAAVGERELALLGSKRKTQLLLDAMLREQPVALTDGPDWRTRVALVQALLALMPPAIRPAYTFATEVFEAAHCAAHFKILYNDPFARPGPNDLTISWSAPGRTIRHPDSLWAAHLPLLPGRGSGVGGELLRAAEEDLPRVLAGQEGDLAPERAAGRALSTVMLQWRAWEAFPKGEAKLDMLGEAKLDLLVEAVDRAPPPRADRLGPMAVAIAEMAVRENRVATARALYRSGALPTAEKAVRARLGKLAGGADGAQSYALADELSLHAEGASAARWRSFADGLLAQHFEFLLAESPERAVDYVREQYERRMEKWSDARWAGLQRLVLPHAQGSPALAAGWLALVLPHGPVKLLRQLWADGSIRDRWPAPLREVAQALTDETSPSLPAGALLRAEESLGTTDAQTLLALTREAIKAGRTALLDRSIWESLRVRVTGESDLHEAGSLFGSKEERRLAGRLPTEDAAALLRFAIAIYHTRAADLYEEASRPPGGPLLPHIAETLAEDDTHPNNALVAQTAVREIFRRRRGHRRGLASDLAGAYRVIAGTGLRDTFLEQAAASLQALPESARDAFDQEVLVEMELDKALRDFASRQAAAKSAGRLARLREKLLHSRPGR